MAFNMFLKIGDIKGDSTDARHAGEVEVLSFSLGASNPSSVATGGGPGGAGAGKVQVSPLHITARSSQASPLLFQACASGKHFKEAVLALRRPVGGQGQEYMVFKLEGVLVSAYRVAGDVEGLAPVDEIELAFEKIEVRYKSFDASGKQGEEVMAGWDLKQNKSI